MYITSTVMLWCIVTFIAAIYIVE